VEPSVEGNARGESKMPHSPLLTVAVPDGQFQKMAQQQTNKSCRRPTGQAREHNPNGNLQPALERWRAVAIASSSRLPQAMIMQGCAENIRRLHSPLTRHKYRRKSPNLFASPSIF
jgi:hypothetical protein